MTVFTHFLFFVSPEAALAATPAGALPWHTGEPWCTLAPLSASVPITAPIGEYHLARAVPNGVGWQLGERLPLPLDYDPERRQLIVNAPPFGGPLLALPEADAGRFHLGLVETNSGALIAVSNALEAQGDLALTTRIRYRNYAPSLVGAYADPALACELRLPLRADWPQYSATSGDASGSAPTALVQKRLRLVTDRWPAPWLEALALALRHDEVLLVQPLGGYEPVMLETPLRITWRAGAGPALGEAEALLTSIAFAPLSLLYDLPPGGFDAGYSFGFSL